MAEVNRFGQRIETDYTRKMAQFVSDLKFEDLSEEIVERVKLITLHTIGCSIASAPMETTIGADQVAAKISGGPGAATSWVSGRKLSLLAAAFVNGTVSDMLDWEDCSYTGHPSAALVPGTMALCETQKANGRDYITAFVAGYEIYQRVALSVASPVYNRKDPKMGTSLPNCPIFGAAMSAAKIYGLSPEQCNQAMGMAVLFLKQFSNLQQATMTEAYHYEYGWCTQGGIQAALCVREGISGPMDCFDTPYAFTEHLNTVNDRSEIPQWLDNALGERFMVMELLLKHWPANMYLQTPIEIAVELARDENIDLEQVAEVILDPPARHRMHFRPEGYTSVMDAEFSAPFCIAAALVDPNAGPQWFSKENMKNPKVLELGAKIKGSETKLNGMGPVFTVFYQTEGKGFPDRSITFKMKDGTVYERTQAFHKGHPAMMYTQEELHEQFLRQTTPNMSVEKAEKLYQFIIDLENQADISAISALFGR